MAHTNQESIPKRVACFYRVSTKGQLDGNDIPMQKRACRDFIEKQGWVLVKEYTERGVSGYKVSANDRDEIQRAKQDAENKLFDVLLCFMFDRLGRKQDETPFVLKWFSKKGIELWSCKEGQQKFEDHSDELINFIRFWQSGGESKKTSMRVNEKHEQMVKDGLFRGGKPPYGYKLIPSGIVNKKGKELMKLSINDEQSNVVQKIFNFVFEEGLGSNRIVQYLNENNIPSHSGGKWNTGVVNFILRNPIYKGYMTYGKRKATDDGNYLMQNNSNWVMSEKPIEELIIINEKIWDKVQLIRSSRSPDKMKNNEFDHYKVSKSPLLFVGNIKCGHCNSPLTTTYNSKKYQLKDGTIRKWTAAKYRCSGKALGKTDCNGQTIYAQSKIEETVLEEIYIFLDQLKQVDFTEQLEKYNKKHLVNDQKEIQKLQKQLESSYSEIITLKNEVTKSILGQSHFKPEMLSNLIEEKENSVFELNNKIEKLQDNLNAKKIEVDEMKELQSNIPEWRTVFNNASHEKKKMMLNAIIDDITVTREMIDVKVKLNIQQFISSVNGSEQSLLGRASESKTLPSKIIERSFSITFAA